MPKHLNFDKVDHGVLLNKLKTFGICGKLGEWLHSFLTNRRHHVRIPGGVSKSDNVLSGVPQGTVLGPVLFLVLISNISNNVNSNITSFADDTRVGVKYSTCTWYLYLSTYLSVLEYLVNGNAKVLVLVLVLDQKVLGTYK